MAVPAQPPAAPVAVPTGGRPATGRPGQPVAGGPRSTPAQPVAVNSSTNVVRHGDHNSFDIRHKGADGSQMVITQQLRPDGTKKILGFKQTDNPSDGTSTRIFSDGQRVIKGRDFERHSFGSGLGFVSKNNGLREAVLPDGRPAFQDRFTSVRDRSGSEQQIIERTRYARWSNGRPDFEARPMVHQYDVGHINGAPVAHYRPSHYSPDFYRGFKSRYAVPVVVAGIAAAAAWVAFGSPATSYDDPVTMMGDMQISSGFAEGYAYSVPSGATPVYDTPEAAALRSQMASVQQQVNASVQGNGAIKAQLDGVDVQAASSQVQQAVGSAMPVQISEEVRDQVRKQVRLSVAMQQNGRALILADVLASGYAKIFLFQAAQPVSVGSPSTGGECFLNTGDLIGFSKLPTRDGPVAEMKVVASSANSCQAGELVQVRLTDLQEMLNGFSERVEDNMRHVSACAATGRC